MIILIYRFLAGFHFTDLLFNVCKLLQNQFPVPLLLRLHLRTFLHNFGNILLHLRNICRIIIAMLLNFIPHPLIDLFKSIVYRCKFINQRSLLINACLKLLGLKLRICQEFPLTDIFLHQLFQNMNFFYQTLL